MSSSSQSGLVASFRRSLSFSSSSTHAPQSLTDACNTSQLEVVQKAIRKGLRPTADTLTTACTTGDVKIVDAVLQAGATPNHQTLSAACASNIIEIVKKVIWQGAKSTSEAFQIATLANNQKILDLLELAPRTNRSRQSSATQTATTSTQETPNELTQACINGNAPAVLAAIEKGIKPQKFTLLRGAESGNPDIIDLLLNAEAQPHEESGSAPSELTAAFRAGSPESAKKLIMQFADLAPDQETLSAAFASGDLNAVELVLALDAKPDDQTLNRAVLGFLAKNPAKIMSAIDKAVAAGATTNKETLDLALRHCEELESPGPFISYLHNKTKAPISEKSLTLGCKSQLKSILSYDALIKTLLNMGAKPDKETFSSIRWTQYSVEHQRQFVLYNDTIESLFEKGLKPTQAEIDHLRSQIVEVSPSTSRGKREKEEEVLQQIKNELYRKVVTLAEAPIKT